jgi:hypothetical protein
MIQKRFPPWLMTVGWWVAVPSAIFALRMVYERTIMTWNEGPQMVGFSFLHTIGGPFLLALWLGLVWVAVVLFYVVRCRSFGGGKMILVLAIYGLAWGLSLIPYGLWQRMFVSRLVSGPHASQFLVYAAVDGDIKLVSAFLSGGVSVNVQNRRDGMTPLHGAARGGDVKTIEYLIAQGADLNVVDRYGDSPLENAIASNQSEASKLLAARGARRIRGTDEQRDKASSGIVRESIEESDRRRRERDR